ncbi:hypothetical protein PI124_g16875 [Phytophthora idaei]|nr:hypothetical protein PI125_g13608 [Phytophthora idaei]KAG3147822.1 hypothetical protein PI126_g12727 [Phytophthora idaei]KAG3238157.1 hypothetical protein PI124_g16875 [Phytophthora idaei]
MEEELAPLLIVELLFRAKSMTDLPHVIKLVWIVLWSFLFTKRADRDLSISLSAFGTAVTFSRAVLRAIVTGHSASISPYQFTLSMMEAVRLKNLEMVEWLTDRFQRYTVRESVVVEATGVGATDILQFLHDNDNASVDPAIRDLTRCFKFSGLASMLSLRRLTVMDRPCGG